MICHQNSFLQIGVINGSVEHRLGMRIIGSKGDYLIGLAIKLSRDVGVGDPLVT